MRLVSLQGGFKSNFGTILFGMPQLESKLEQKLLERLRSLVTWKRFSGIGICLVSLSNSI